jgi:hypothetical protein
MSEDEKAHLEAEVAAAEAAVTRIRAENAETAAAFRASPDDSAKEILKRGAASLAAARDRVATAKAALRVFEKTGTPHGLVADDGRLVGTIAVQLAPGTLQKDREIAIDAVLADQLEEGASELGVVLAAKPSKYTKERPGRDAQGRTIFEVAGRVEGDRLTPAVSRASKNLRQ